MESYKDCPYEIILQRLQGGAGFEGYRIVWINTGAEERVKQVFPSVPTFTDDEQARRQIERDV